MIFGSIPHHIQKNPWHDGFDSTVCTCLNQIEIILSEHLCFPAKFQFCQLPALLWECVSNHHPVNST